jgi:hypothetical protein
MTVKKASEIVGLMFMWQMFHMGVEEAEPNKLDDKLTLSDLIIARNKISKRNDYKRLQQQKFPDKYPKGITQQMTVSDAVIAAVYTGLVHKVSKQSIACVNGKYIGVFK